MAGINQRDRHENRHFWAVWAGRSVGRCLLPLRFQGKESERSDVILPFQSECGTPGLQKSG